MRPIDRGPIPSKVKAFDECNIKHWVKYYCGIRQGEPRRFWVAYIEELGSKSNYNCWYCERRCKITIKVDGKEQILVKGDWSANIDHFRPRSLFPHLSLSWSNWVFSCKSCNNTSKKDKWPNTNVFPCAPHQNEERPELEYVNPCTLDPIELPDNYFCFFQGRIEPRPGISDADRNKVSRTICDLDLNNWTLVKPRYRSVLKFANQFCWKLKDMTSEDSKSFADDFLTRPAHSRVKLLVENYADREGILEYPGIKSLVAEEILRNGRQGLERLGLPETILDER